MSPVSPVLGTKGRAAAHRGASVAAFPGAAAGALAAEAETAGELPIVPPEFEITEDRLLPSQQPWRHAERLGLEILTNASDGVGR